MNKAPLALIIGGTSAIGRAIARAMAAEGYDIILSVRDAVQGEMETQDLRLRFKIHAESRTLDVLNLTMYEAFLNSMPRLPDAVIWVAGSMEDQAMCEQHPEMAERMMRVNYLAPALFLGQVANAMQARGMGLILGISSVAGDRGRAKNYLYGSAKAGFTAFLSGLRNRLAARGVRVITIKPGFVRSPMTKGMQLPAPLTAEPEEVAKAIMKAISGKKDVVYVRPIWWLIMLIISMIPEFIFKKMKI